MPEDCGVLHHRASHRDELADPQQAEVAMSEGFKGCGPNGRHRAWSDVVDCTARRGTCRVPSGRGHGTKDRCYFRSTIVTDWLRVNFNSVSLGISAASPRVASDAAAPPPPPTAAPMPAPMPTFLASLPFDVFAS